jgi:hypothetical protein
MIRLSDPFHVKGVKAVWNHPTVGVIVVGVDEAIKFVVTQAVLNGLAAVVVYTLTCQFW